MTARLQPAYAQTAPIVLAAGNNPVVRVMMRSGTLRIRTWNRSDVQASSQQPLMARSFRPEAVAQALSGSIPIFATSVMVPGGQLVLPPEELALTTVPAGPHTAIVVQAQDADVTLDVPAGTALLLANVQRGNVDVQKFRGGTFALLVHNGAIRLRNVSGTGYAQVARGVFMARDSTFDHLRARSAVGTLLFEHCTARQIEVTAVEGTIVYDGGNFQRGLARFESGSGNVAIGIGDRDVQLTAHSSVGRIYSALAGNGVRAGQTDVQIGRGRTVVSASSERGAVYLYSGSLRQQGKLPAEWAPVARFMPRRQPRRPAPPITH